MNLINAISPHTIIGKHVSLRLVEVSDAEFIYTLRSDKKARFLTHTSGRIPAQEQWIESCKKRESAGEEFHFVIQRFEDKSCEIGKSPCEVKSFDVVSIDDFKEERFCWGSWIIQDDAPSYVAIESALCLYAFGFYTLGSKRVRLCSSDVSQTIARHFNKSHLINLSKADDYKVA